MNESNKQYFPNNYGGTAGYDYANPTTSTSKPTSSNSSSSSSGSISFNTDNKGTYKTDTNGNKIYMNESNKQYFPNNYGGTAGYDYVKPTTPTTTVNTSVNSTLGAIANRLNTTTSNNKTNSNGYNTSYLNSEYGKLANDLSYEGLKKYNEVLESMKGTDVRQYANDEYALRMWEIANGKVNSKLDGTKWSDPEFASTNKRYENDISESDSVTDFVFNMLGPEKLSSLKGMSNSQIASELSKYGIKGADSQSIDKLLTAYENGLRPTSQKDKYLEWLKETNLQGTPQLERIFKEYYALKPDGTVELMEGLTDLNGKVVNDHMYIKYGDDMQTMYQNILNNEKVYGKTEKIPQAAKDMLASGNSGINSTTNSSTTNSSTTNSGTTNSGITNSGIPYAPNDPLYNNPYSTHIIGATANLDPNDPRMTVDQYGNWVSDQYGTDNKGTYVLKGGDPNKKVYMTDQNKKYFPSNYGGTGDFMYDANNKVTYTEATKEMRTDKDYALLGDVNKFSPEKLQQYIDYDKKYEGMTMAQLQEIKKNASLLERNYISSMDGTMFEDGKFKGIAPIAVAPESMQENMQNYLYNYMRDNGINNFNGMSTKQINEMLNASGLGGIVDINNVNVPYVLEQQIKAQAQAKGDEAYLDIDPKVILDEIVANGGLKRGYLYNNQTGEITVDPRYVQIGDVLADRGEAIRWYGNEQGWFDQRSRNEQVTGKTEETPLELRERYAPQTMTEEMKIDLAQEREIKTQLEQLTLQLQEIEALEQGGSGSGLILSSSGGVSGLGGNGLGRNNTNSNQYYGTYGMGGNSTYKGVTGGGRNAVYGISQKYTNADINLLNALSRRIG